MNVTKYEGLQLRKLRHGGYLVCHPDIYNQGSLYFAATTIDEAFVFLRASLDGPSPEYVDAPAHTIGEGEQALPSAGLPLSSTPAPFRELLISIARSAYTIGKGKV